MTDNTSSQKQSQYSQSNQQQSAADSIQKEVLKQFGRLAMHRPFQYFAAMSCMPDDWYKHQRGPRRVFAVLAEKDGMTNAELAEELDVKPSSVTALVDRLEQGGLVCRQSSPTDKRVTLIRLTQKGRERVEERQDEREKMMDAAFASLTPEEQKKLGELLGKVADNLDREYPQDVENAPGSRSRRGFGGHGFPGTSGFPGVADFPGGGFGSRQRGPAHGDGVRRFGSADFFDRGE